MSKIAVLIAGLAAFVLAGGKSAIPAGAGADIVGRIDTVGGTTYDWQFTGPVPSWVYYDPGYGIHVAWTYSNDTSSSYPDRNTRYNFYDFATGVWNWIDPDIMQSGVNMFTERTGLGSFDVNPITHCAFSVVHTGTPIHPVLARDIARGAGIFEYCDGSPVCDGYLWPRVSVGNSGKAHVALADDASRHGLYYSGVDPWCTWSTPFHIPAPLPDPGFPAYAIAASKQRPHVCIMWTAVDSEPRRLYYRRSTDDGLTWLPPESLPTPPAFHPGSDTLVSVGANDLYPWYDPEGEDDDFSVAVAVYPVLQGQGLVVPVELWHWRQGSGWSRIARAECDTAHMAGGIGDAALYASRPTLGRCAATRQLVCVWEQFDSANVEPRTGLLRADVWAARGDSAGTHWGMPVRLTAPDSTSKRFPCVAGWTMDDTFVVTYEVDRCAGFADMGQGPATENPIAAQYVSIESLPPPDAGVAEQPSTTEPTHGFGATVVRTLLCLPLGVVAVHGQSPCLLDIAGRKVLDLQPGANDVRALAPGVYFVASAFGGGHGASGVSKVVLTR